MNKFIRKEEEKKVKRGEKRVKKGEKYSTTVVVSGVFQGRGFRVVVVVVVVSYMSCG